MNLRSGVKIYDNDWFVRLGLTIDEAADLLAAWNVTYVISQSRVLPMQDSAVPSAVADRDRDRYAALDDRAFRDALAARGIAYIACLNIGFDPAFATARPDLLPVDQHGTRAERQDWYVGMPPDRAENTAHKIDLLTRGVAALEPDGVHLGFVRWPGFWETWLPGTDREAKPEYCFAPETLGRFMAATGIALPTDARQAAASLRGAHAAAWTRWKCGITVEQIRTLRAAFEPIRPGMPVSINTLPFFRDDFGNAVESVFGQDVARLAAVVDIFEVMAYHQILRQPAGWPAAVATDIRARGGRAAICTVQASPLYLKGMHAGRGRAPDIDASEFASMLDAIERSPVEGVCIFTFTDLLDARETARGRAMIERLSGFRR